MKFRLNSNLLKKVFNARDQEVFKSLKDTQISAAADSKFSDLKISLLPQNGEAKDFDFNLNIARDDVGASSDNLAFQGSGKYDGNDFEFSGPIKNFKMYYALGEKYNHDHDYNALVFQEQPFQLDIDHSSIKATGQDVPTEELSGAIIENLTRIKSEVQDAKKELIKDFPMDLAVPFVFMFYATQFSKEIIIDDKSIQLDFSFSHLNLLKKKQ